MSVNFVRSVLCALFRPDMDFKSFGHLLGGQLLAGSGAGILGRWRVLGSLDRCVDVGLVDGATATSCAEGVISLVVIFAFRIYRWIRPMTLVGAQPEKDLIADVQVLLRWLASSIQLR